MSRAPRPGRWLVLLVAVCGCARSAVPTLTVADFTRPELSELEPRVLELQVTDQRPIVAEEQRATERHLRQVLTELFESSGVSLAPAAPHALSIVIGLPNANDVGMDPTSCVELEWELRLNDGAATKATTVGCAAWSTAEGAVFASVTGAFKRAMQARLAGLDADLGRLVRVESPLRFDPVEIDVPDFAWLTPRAVVLEVVDEASLAGGAGSSLRSAVESAFARSNLRVAADARYHLVLTLGTPTDGKGPVRPCVELSADISSPGEGFTASRRECPPEGAGGGSRLVSSVLRALDEQRAKVHSSAVGGSLP